MGEVSHYGRKLYSQTRAFIRKKEKVKKKPVGYSLKYACFKKMPRRGAGGGHEAQIGGARHFFCLSDHAPIKSRRVLSGRVHQLPVDSCDRRRRTTPEQRRSLLKGEGTGRANLEVGAIPVDDVTTRKCREQPGVRRGCCSCGFPSRIESPLTLDRDDTTIIDYMQSCGSTRLNEKLYPSKIQQQQE